MSVWSAKRRLYYGGSVVFVLFLATVFILWNFFYRAPSCTDKMKNGDEKGIDCGGSCTTICTNDTLTPVVLWSKTFNISGNVYSAVAYVENPNINSENGKASYRFSIYDADNNLMTVLDGETSIPKNKKFALFETGIVLKNGKPKTTNFEFISFSPWQKNMEKDPDITVDHGELLSTSTTPKVLGNVTNKSLEKLKKVELVVFIYDNKQNVIAASRTYVDNLMRNMPQDFFFTWPKPFNLGVESCTTSLDLAIALDRSGSMSWESKNPPEPFSTVISTAQNFIKNLTQDDQVSVISFGTNSKQESQLSVNKEIAIGAINNLTLGTTTEQTNIFGGLNDAFQELKSERTRDVTKKVLVLLTDGVPTEPKDVNVPNNPVVSAEKIADEIKKSGIIVYTIGLGKDASEPFLKEISSSPNNNYFFAPSKETLTSIYKKITSQLCIKKPNAITVIYRVL